MKNIFSFLSFLLIGHYSFSQTPDWKFALNATNGTNWETGFGIISAPSGNIYFSGRANGSDFTLEGKTTAFPGNVDFTGKMNSAGLIEWLSPHPHGTVEYDYAFAIDNSENNYTAGVIQDGSPYGSYIDKYDSTGNLKWNVYNSNSVVPYGIAVDNNGNVYECGYFVDSATFGNFRLNSAGDDDIFLVKYDSSGNVKWAVSAGGTGKDEGREVLVDQGGNIYICGGYSNTPSFGTITPPAQAGSNSDFFIAKYDSSGNALWVTPATNAEFGPPAGYDSSWNGLTMDSCNNLYVTGHYNESAQFGNLPSINSAGSADIFVAKCLNNGQWEWVKSAGGDSDDEATGIAIDKRNDIYITGYFESTAQFGSTSLTSGGSRETFVAKYANSTGDLQWVQSTEGTGSSNGQGITVDNQGYVYIIGNASDQQTFGSNDINATTLGGDIFIAKIDTASILNIIPHPNPSYCAGSTTSLSFNITGVFNGSNAFTAELSDSSGSFVSPDTLGSYKSISGGQINISIPTNVLPGTKYIIRIVSSNPATGSRYYCNSFIASANQTSYATVTISNGVTLKVSADTTICSGTPHQLYVSGGNNYTWTPSIALSCTDCANPVASPISSQTYMVTANADSACAGSASIVINVLPPVNLITNPADDTTVCGGKSIQLSVSGAATYLWSSLSTINCTTCSSNLVAPTADTTVYSVTGTSADGKCSAIKQVSVFAGNSAIGGEITSPRDTICQGTSGKLTLTNYLGSPVEWQSSTNDINFTNINTPDTSNYNSSPLFQTTWYRAIIGSGACVATSDTIRLFVPATLISKFDYTASNKVVTFNSDSSRGSIRTYSWNFGDNSSFTNEANPIHTFPKDTTYYVCLTLYDGSDCSNTYCRYISGLDGINTVDVYGNWNIYPNPMHNLIIISGTSLVKDIYSIEMYDMLGRMVETLDSSMLNTNRITLNVSDLLEGMYFLKIHTEKADYIQKIVKE